MSRRVSLPAADELFRNGRHNNGSPREMTVVLDQDDAAPAQETAAETAARRSSGRVRHDEKMTVYVTAEELLDLEDARLALRRLGVTVDRGRLVRAAISLALVDLDEHGADSAIAGRLGQA